MLLWIGELGRIIVLAGARSVILRTIKASFQIHIVFSIKGPMLSISQLILIKLRGLTLVPVQIHRVLILVEDANLNISSTGLLTASSSLLTFRFLSSKLLDLIAYILRFLKPISDWIFLQPVFLIVHGYHFVSHSAKFHGVSDAQFVAFVRLDVVVLVICHVLHAEPKLLSWCCFFFLGVFDCILVIYPKVVIFEESSGNQLFVIGRRRHQLREVLFVLSHRLKIVKVFLYYVVIVPF